VRAVASVHAQHDVATRVVVVDNASDEPPMLGDAGTGVTLLHNGVNRGVAPARNQGAAVGDAPYLLLLDSDARLEPGALAALVDVLDGDPTIGIAAPVFTGQAPEASGGKAPSPGRKLARGVGLTARYAGMGQGAGEAVWDVDFVIGACQLVRRDAWTAVGGLDETYFYGPEDLDLCLRLRALGHRVVQVRAARCEHPPRRRHRSLFTPGGLAHAGALLRHYRRQGRVATR
jgi:GT2 family glycosyltransferase